MRRLLVLLCAAAMLAAGCGKSDKKLKIGVSVPEPTHSWAAGIISSAEQAKKSIEAANPDVEVVVAPGGNGAAQVNAIEQLLMQNVDALVVVCQEPEPLANICAEAKKRGIYLVIVSNPLPVGIQDVYVNGDNTSFGRAAAEAMGRALGGKGDILVMEGILSPINTERVNGFREVLAAKYPDIRILDSQPSNWNPDQGLRLMETYLQNYPKVDGVWAGDDDVLPNALKAYRESGRGDVKVFVGGGGSKTVVGMILDHDPLVKATVSYHPNMTAVGVNAALAGLRNGKVPPEGKKEIIIPSEVIDASNAQAHYFPDSKY